MSDWIPVSERLPKNNGRYLVTVKLNKNPSVHHATEDECVTVIGSYYNGINRFSTSDVIAWMPLFEPYNDRTSTWTRKFDGNSLKWRCDHCRHMFYDKTKYCPDCGYEMKTKEVNNDGNVAQDH